MARKARLQITKDYVVFPLLSGLAAAAVETALGRAQARTGASLRDDLARARFRRTFRRR